MIDTNTSGKPDVITIHQGRSRSPYFCIIQPASGEELKIGQTIRCLNPRTQNMIHGIVTEHFWTFDWEEMETWAEVKLLEIYGVEPDVLRTALIASDHRFKDSWARLVLIREIICNYDN